MARVRKGTIERTIQESLVDFYVDVGWEVVERQLQEENAILTISYKKIDRYDLIPITDANYIEYGYQKDTSGYYISDKYLDEKVYFTEHELPVYIEVEYNLPSPSALSISYADVDRDNSGRNSNDGMMVRERIGHYIKLDISWNLVPNEEERETLVRFLRELPPQFTLDFYDSTKGNERSRIIAYRGDISENAFAFLKDNKIWTGLKTTFIQFDVTPYNDGV